MKKEKVEDKEIQTYSLGSKRKPLRLMLQLWLSLEDRLQFLGKVAPLRRSQVCTGIKGKMPHLAKIPTC